MRFVSVRDLRNKSAAIWKMMAVEKDIVITSKGRPIAILSQANETSLEESLAILRRARAMEAVEAMQLDACKKGRNRMTLQEIDTEIRLVRKQRHKSRGKSLPT